MNVKTAAERIRAGVFPPRRRAGGDGRARRDQPDELRLDPGQSAARHSRLCAAWRSRSANILVTKPGFYWLTFSSLGTPTEKFGGALDDVKLTALGGPSMSGAPSSYVTLPTPSVAPGSISIFSGFEIVNDPITAPAATL